MGNTIMGNTPSTNPPQYQPTRQPRILTDTIWQMHHKEQFFANTGKFYDIREAYDVITRAQNADTYDIATCLAMHLGYTESSLSPEHIEEVRSDMIDGARRYINKIMGSSDYKAELEEARLAYLNVKPRIDELEREIMALKVEIKTMIEYAPGGPGYEEAKKEFTQLSM